MIEDIIVGVGRTGALTPVAVLKPVIVSGVEVKRATLHNEDEIRRKDIMIGDTVIVSRAGDVIPEVVKVIKEKRAGEERPFVMPDKCPVCGEEVVRPPGEAIRRCVNINCPAQIKGSIEHFASKRAMDVDGLGEKLVEQLVDKGAIKDVSDLYYLTRDDLARLERMADKSAGNVMDAISGSKNLLSSASFTPSASEMWESTYRVFSQSGITVLNSLGRRGGSVNGNPRDRP